MSQHEQHSKFTPPKAKYIQLYLNTLENMKKNVGIKDRVELCVSVCVLGDSISFVSGMYRLTQDLAMCIPELEVDSYWVHVMH